ncbi:MAG: adenylosuccinate synthase [Flavobacteriales bacterium]|nr:adenylosuccinate synthase [Flavobacteriales bacterium]MBK7753150.1 adenylosuccinate synthase [Flavobacteriales bacterium]MBK9074995.1 adenylosuccinate synthase [Flavobacteriales bacterium]MBK9540147.1 adenylosuccinate synthase [Flavobacteriales bacterium]
MPARMDVLLGAQWGDEGKGKVVDVVAPSYQVIARFQGGPNAGHTLWIEGRKHVLHTIPSGVFHEGATNLVGNGVVIDPVTFLEELDGIAAAGVDLKDRLLISRRAHLILPTHRALDAASEAEKGGERIGSTLKGIGPTYMDKTGRNGLRVGDLERPDLMDRYRALVRKHERLLGLYGSYTPDKEGEQRWLQALERMRSIPLVDSEHYLDEAFSKGKAVLAEGAQGTLLDIDFGTYPYVTSSNTVCAGACTGLGVPPSRIGKVIGIFKAYCTRVGSGPFPTELLDDTGERIRIAGNEFGSTTGRPRRCGWLDLPALRYAVMVNGITELAMMKSDVLSGMDPVRLCTNYRVNGRTIDRLPYDIADAEPIFQDLPGWGALDGDTIPDALERYIRHIEEAVRVPIRLVSTGPDRRQTLERRSPVAAI